MIWAALQYLAMTLFVIGSATLSSWYVYSTYAPSSVHVAWAFVLVVIGMEITKPLSVRAAFGHFGWKAIAPGIVGAVVCVSASSYFELQVVARGREAYAVEASGVVGTKSELDTRRREIEARIRQLGPTRTAGEMVPLVDRARASAGDCDRPRGRTARERCDELAALLSEHERALVLARYQQQIAQLDNRKDAVQPATAESRSVSAVLGRFGVRFRPDQIEPLLAPIMVALLQLGAVIPAAIGPTGTGGTPRDKRRARHTSSSPHDQGGSGGRTAEDRSGTSVHRSTDELISTDHARILEVLRGANGRVEGGERALADRFGLGSRTTLRSALAQLAAAGLITVNKQPSGTTVELSGAPTTNDPAREG